MDDTVATENPLAADAEQAAAASDLAQTAQLIAAGRATLGVELGSTRIKACLVGEDPSVVLATGSHEWENVLVDRLWTYALDDVWGGLQAAYADLVADVSRRYNVQLQTLRAIGVSAMMHGYLALDAQDELLIPFRTWRNTNTGPAAAALTKLFGTNIPLRWSIAHFYEAILDDEPHVPQVRFLTTLAGYVHWRLTGRKVIGVGDASGMFPIDVASGGYDSELVTRFDALVADRGISLAELLPEVLTAGADGGQLTADGAALLDPSGKLAPGALLCPPEGDAGTGMVATNSVAVRTGNVSAGTSIFAMVVLERWPEHMHSELDLVTTPAGDPVAMVHCNNGASELAAWVGLFSRFAAVLGGGAADGDAVYGALFGEALEGEADAGGLLAYNHLSGEPIVELVEGRPLFVRTPDSQFSLANFMRAQLYGVFATLAIGMRVLADEGVALERMFAHGGMFRTAGVAQRFLAAALGAPVAVGATASEGGAWGMAVLAAYAAVVREGGAGAGSVTGAGSAGADGAPKLGAYLAEQVFRDVAVKVVAPDAADLAGFASYLDHYQAGLAAERAAVQAV